MYERCEKLRPTLFRLASDTTDDDDALGKAVLLQAQPQHRKAEHVPLPAGLRWCQRPESMALDFVAIELRRGMPHVGLEWIPRTVWA